MATVIFMENTTASGILLNDLGFFIAASTTVDITGQFDEFHAENSEDLLYHVVNEEIIVSGPEGAYTVAEVEFLFSGASAGTASTIAVRSGQGFVDMNNPGVEFLNALSGTVTLGSGNNTTIETTSATNTVTIASFDDDDVDSITASGVTVTGSVQFETLGGLSVSANASTDTVTISGGSEVGELIGSLFQIEFTNGGNTSNTWLAVSDSNLSGNQTPWVACFPCRLAGVAFSNRNTGVDLDMEFHVARVGDGNTSTNEITYEVRDARTSFKTDIPLDGLVLDPGDKVSVYAANAGGAARDVWFGAYMEIISRTTSEGVEDWSGSIS